MAKVSLVTGTTSYIAQVFIQDSSSTTGAGLAGLVYNSGSLTAYYHRDTDTTATAMTLVTMTVGTWTSLGFKEIDATNMPGWYQLGIPNAALASGAKSVAIHLKGATNMAPLPLEIELTATNNQDAVRGGMSALPNAAAEAAGGLYTRGTGAGQINQPANGMIDGNVVRWLGTAVTAATAGIPDTNAKNINNVAATSVTTINANIGTTQPVNFTGTGASALAKSDMVNIAGAAVSTSTAQIGANAVQAGGTAWNSGAIGTGTFAAGAVNRAALGADTGLQPARSNTAAAGAAGSITLDASASSVNDFYKDSWIKITGGTGAGQTRLCTGYTGSTQVATVAPNWATNPDNTSTFAILPAGKISGVTLVDTTTTLTNAPSDSSGVTTLLSRLSAARAGYLDNLSAGAVALASTVGTPAGASLAADIASIKNDTGTSGVVVAAASKTGYRLSVTGVDDLWAYAESSIGTAGSIGLKLKNTLPQRITKNTALAKFPFVMVDSSDHLTGKTGLTVTAQRSIDGAAFASCANSVVEVSNGVYTIDLAAADLNGNTIVLRFTATGADPRLIALVTEPAAA